MPFIATIYTHYGNSYICILFRCNRGDALANNVEAGHRMLCSCAFSSPTSLVPSPILEGLGTRLQPHPLCMTVCVIVHVAAPPTVHDYVWGAHSGSP